MTGNLAFEALEGVDLVNREGIVKTREENVELLFCLEVGVSFSDGRVFHQLVLV